MCTGLKLVVHVYIPAGVVVIGASLFVLVLDIGHTSELRAFVFYAEVCVYVYACTDSICLPVHMHGGSLCTFVLTSECIPV